LNSEILLLQRENEILEDWFCLLSEELSDKGLKGDSIALIIDETCPALKARVAKRKQQKPVPSPSAKAK
jgi:hypothetical protein